MARAKFLIWIDLETTGVHHIDDPILEIGMIVTESTPPFADLAQGSWVVNPSVSGRGDWRGRLGDYVKNMHTENGLLRDVEDVDVAVGLDQAESEITNMLSTIGREHNFMLAGSGVGHFDRRFIESQMPKLAKWLQYPNLDVGVIRRAFSFAKRDDLVEFGTTFEGEDKPHRGLADVRDHLEEFRLYCKIFESIPANDKAVA